MDAVLSNSKIFDCGTLKGFIGANVSLASKDKFLKKYMEEIIILAQVVELVDTRDLKSLDSNIVPVQVRPWVPTFHVIN